MEYTLNNEPLVTVYMPTHNRIELLQRAIKSVIEQSYKNWELIIVDDGSSDGTYNFLCDLSKNDNRIRCIRHEVPLGACRARNSALKIAKGEFITGLDDDDEFSKERISYFLRNWNPKYSFICCNFFNVDGKGRKSKHFRGTGEYSLLDLLINNEAGNQVFTLLERINGVNGFTNDLKKLQDWDCWIRLCAKYGKFRRLAFSTYDMHHGHEAPRVSNNQSYPKALINLINNNHSIYDKRTKSLINKYLINQAPKGIILDLSKSRSRREIYFIISKALKLTFKKP